MIFAVAAACFTIHIRNNLFLLHATAFIFDPPGDPESKAKALAHYVAIAGNQPVDPDSASFGARLEHELPLELSPVTVLKEGFAFPDANRFGPCGQLVRTVRSVAWLRDIPSHKVLMGTGDKEHAMVALYVNGAYRLFDPTYDFYWTDRSGHVASIDSVRADTAIFAQIYRKVPDYPFDLHDASYLRWSRLGRPGALVRAALVRLMGERWVAGLDTPKVYERPWFGYGWVSLVAALVCLAWGGVWATRRT
ncbi:MAG: hypothetical protein ACHQU1_11685 [Gemmatimonadales bacterium]